MPGMCGLGKHRGSPQLVDCGRQRVFDCPCRFTGCTPAAQVIKASDDAREVRPWVECQPRALLPQSADVIGHCRVVLEQVESTVRRVDRTGANTCGLPVDDPGQLTANPQDVAGIEVPVNEPDIRVRNRPVEQLDGAFPQLWS